MSDGDFSVLFRQGESGRLSLMRKRQRTGAVHNLTEFGETISRARQRFGLRLSSGAFREDEVPR
jgi:hypothetical protein